MIKVSVVGATGYAGAELVRLLMQHKDVKIVHMCSKSFAGQPISNIYANMTGADLPILENIDVNALVNDSDVIFTSLPHGASGEVIPQLYSKGTRIIDLSGDFRYNDVATYEKWYGKKHDAPELLDVSVYGMPELHREQIKNAQLVGNPGCYTTCSILALAPLVANKIVSQENIIIDSKSGTTGAGRSSSTPFSFCEVNESFKAYNVAKHRHTSEIEQELSLLAGSEITLSFTPHLVPINRGIFSTIYANYQGGDVLEAYQNFYKNEPFVAISSDSLPELKHVVGSNFCKIGFVFDERLNRLVIISVLDNLIKGAGGQAIQNMNIMFGLEETAGLSQPAWYL